MARRPRLAIMQAAKFALIERLRRVDEPVLDTLLVSSLSPELGPDDVAAALRVGAEDAQVLGGPRPRQRPDRAVAQPRVPAIGAPLHRRDHRHRAPSRHRDRTAACRRSNHQRCQRISRCGWPNTGCSDDRLATALADLASRTRGQPARAARLYRAAADAGATALSARLADALALTGDCTTAGRLADELLGSEDAAERAAAVRIAASIAMHDGSAAQAADLFRWLGPYPDAFVSAAGAIVAVAAGDLEAAGRR